MTRSISFEDAKRLYRNRFTLDHVPNWAFKRHNDMYYAPQYASDREWYDRTVFPREEGHHGFGKDCDSRRATYPLGVWLYKPYRGRLGYVNPDDAGMPLPIHDALVLSRTPAAYDVHP